MASHFFIAGIFAVVWLIIALYKALKAKSVKDVLGEIKKSSFDLNKNNDDKNIKNGILNSISGEKLLIIKASYGLPEKTINVTKELSQLIAEGKLKIKVSNDIAYDPIPGKNKILTIQYSHEGKIQTKEIREGDEVNLP
ncbi:MAG: DUF3395 domain-containing protein [Patescibacteria group bacterium]|jgi:hypothetical protein